MYSGQHCWISAIAFCRFEEANSAAVSVAGKPGSLSACIREGNADHLQRTAQPRRLVFFEAPGRGKYQIRLPEPSLVQVFNSVYRGHSVLIGSGRRAGEEHDTIQNHVAFQRVDVREYTE